MNSGAGWWGKTSEMMRGDGSRWREIERWTYTGPDIMGKFGWVRRWFGRGVGGWRFEEEEKKKRERRRGEGSREKYQGLGRKEEKYR